MSRTSKSFFLFFRKLAVFSLAFSIGLFNFPFGTFEIPSAHATHCANDGSVTFVDDGAGHCIATITTTGNNNFIVPSDWNNSSSTVEVVGAGGPVEVFGPQTRFIAGAYEAGEGLLKRFVSKLSYVRATF